MYHPAFTSRKEHAKALMKRSGYKTGGAVSDEAQDRKMIAKGVHEHEAHLHKGEKETKIKLAHGGHVDGKKSHSRLDKMARGGRMHKGKPHTKITIVNAPQGGGPAAGPMMPPGGPMGAPLMAAMAGPAPGGIPMRKSGGKIPHGKVPHMTAGAASGVGREQKVREYGTKPKA